MAVLTPDNLARKTYRDILAANSVAADEDCPEIKIEGNGYHINVMESEYDASNQISANEGDIVLHDLVTYGYGETIVWTTLVARVAALEAWCKTVCTQFQCSYTIKIGANYW